jgi:FKBP-type peptidyl-prolyl cis-trans isomerase FklB
MGLYPKITNYMNCKMKNLALFIGVLCLLGSAACAQKGGGKKGNAAPMKTKMDTVSYIFGMGLGKNIRQAEIEDVNVDQMVQGLRDALESDSAMKISLDDGNLIVRAFMEEDQKRKAEAALAEVDAYMSAKAKEDGILSTESGILYEVVKMGDGEKPVPSDKVRVHYEGTTTDGAVFDSSYERGNPAEFGLNRVIAGWTEILQLMPVGSTFIATIPPNLAYGERGSPPKIGPNEVLVFKIELLDIVTAE